jgi:hypothetical protein
MPSLNTILRSILPVALACLVNLAEGQSGAVESPYSAYGFGDLVPAVRTSQALMAGAGVAFTEPFTVLSDNPASYSGLARPVFDINITARRTDLRSATSSAQRSEASFMGFSLGVPFGKGRWGLALGLNPYTDVSYGLTERVSTEVGVVERSYTGSGGLDRVFAGVGHTVLVQRADSLGHTGNRLFVGANFNFLFGSIEQTRDAVYPFDGGFSNLRAFSSLLLRAPSGDVGAIWQGDLTRKATKESDNWRYGIGVSAQLPVQFRATYSDLISTYARNSSGIETLRDSVVQNDGVRGQVDLPFGLGFGLSVRNTRWIFTAEARYRDWSDLSIEVPGYTLPAPTRAATTLIAAARFNPSFEGSLFQRTVYRAGVRYGQDYLVVNDQGLNTMAMTLGLSLPINALQTNSYIHIGGEFGRRGETTNGLIQEQYATLWLGLSITPWKLERWFQPYRIQ